MGRSACRLRDLIEGGAHLAVSDAAHVLRRILPRNVLGSPAGVDELEVATGRSRRTDFTRSRPAIGQAPPSTPRTPAEPDPDLIGHTDHRALSDRGMGASTASIALVESRCPAS
jgi:hypothetical protein